MGNVSLVELLVVVLIIGALAIIAVPRFLNTRENAQINTCSTNRGSINMQIESYLLDTGSYPVNLNSVTQNTNYFPDGTPECPKGGSYSLNNKKTTDCTHLGGGGGCGGGGC